MDNNWLTKPKDILASLIGDEAKNLAILQEVEKTAKQLVAKSKFRLALLHTLNEKQDK
jgi:hypothetical protein